MRTRYPVLIASIALLGLVPGCTSNKTAPAPAASDDHGGAPELMQLLRERMAHGGSHVTKPAKGEVPASAAASDTSKANGVADAAAASGRAVDPVKQKMALAVADDYAHAMELANSGQDDQALALLQQVATKAPALSGPLVNQGIILERQGHLPEAEQALRNAIKINPDNAYAYNELGVILRQQGKFADAKAAYLKALEIDPGYAKAHFNLGVLADLYLQDYPLAIEQYQAYQGQQEKTDKTVANWIVDLEKRTGTYKPPPKPAPAAASGAASDMAASGSDSGAAPAASGTSAANAGSGVAAASGSAAGAQGAVAPASSGSPKTAPGGKS